MPRQAQTMYKVEAPAKRTEEMEIGKAASAASKSDQKKMETSAAQTTFLGNLQGGGIEQR